MFSRLAATKAGQVARPIGLQNYGGACESEMFKLKLWWRWWCLVSPVFCFSVSRSTLEKTNPLPSAPKTWPLWMPGTRTPSNFHQATRAFFNAASPAFMACAVANVKSILPPTKSDFRSLDSDRFGAFTTCGGKGALALCPGRPPGRPGKMVES